MNQILFDRHRSIAARAVSCCGTTQKNGDCAIAFSGLTEKTLTRRQNGKKERYFPSERKKRPFFEVSHQFRPRRERQIRSRALPLLR
ncbi:hypothetical protein [Paraburkholderia tuberum]|uniref:hypothetical protein n=1 Tax=Paraburkholderia tuberum TaxID=157910 RepID=UPI00115FCB93|nr:hypothetical protein [Paraburkholderia tuberum]